MHGDLCGPMDYTKKADNKGYADINSLAKILVPMLIPTSQWIIPEIFPYHRTKFISIVLVFPSAAACACDPDHITL